MRLITTHGTSKPDLYRAALKTSSIIAHPHVTSKPDLYRAALKTSSIIAQPHVTSKPDLCRAGLKTSSIIAQPHVTSKPDLCRVTTLGKGSFIHKHHGLRHSPQCTANLPSFMNIMHHTDPSHTSKLCSFMTIIGPNRHTKYCNGSFVHKTPWITPAHDARNAKLIFFLFFFFAKVTGLKTPSVIE